ncbi:M56 family metallopeptidase [Mariniflexile sp. HMF6888]|uniref:M56 family metallopeptidase n=1 Tax=Mariniflexile sp. HMF6888 TaxID=3373086 RepID=UPI003798456D
MVHYIIQVIAFQLVFLLIYDVFLKRETFFNWNRAYLIGSALISVIIPFIKIDGFKEVVPQKFIINLPEVLIGNVTQNNQTNLQLETLITESKPLFDWETILYLGMLLAILGFAFKISKMFLMLARNSKSKHGNLFIVKLQNSNAAFSFFHYIFLGELLNENERASILKHEIVHVKEKHTLDLLFFEVLRILFWFNPLVYMYQNRMMALHEFIADAKAVKNEDKSTYYQNLLAQVFETKNISFINPFFKQSLIKKRIVMLQKSKSKQVHLFKYTLLIPMVFGMLVYTSCIQNLNAQQTNNSDVALNKNSPISELVWAIKRQIQVQGNVSDEEDKGLKLLMKIVKEDSLNPELVNNVTVYANQKNKTQLMEIIAELFNQIQIQGRTTSEEEKAIKSLLILTTDGAFDDPFFADELESVEIPFGVIDQVPVFPSCDSLETNEERKACMAKGIMDHVSKNFNTNIAIENNLVGQQRINVIFKIDKEGNIVDVRSRAPHPTLKAEAIRVVKMLPKMIPGEHKGKKVIVPYSLPIIFQVQDDKPQGKKE